jgi:SNF2 family DNA or RNA helicase
MSLTLAVPEKVGEQLEPGDRIELWPTGKVDQLRMSSCAALARGQLHEVEDPLGRPLEVEGAGTLLSLPGLGRVVGQLGEGSRHSLWLEYQESGRFRLVVEPFAVAGAADASFSQDSCLDQNDQDWELLFQGPGREANLEEFRLGLRAARLATHGGFDQLICLPLLREMEILEHQVLTAKTVLRRFRGRAMLCDEVGLGKTIEAGIVVSELITRGLVRSLLVITPPSLVEQWQGELRRKFSLDCVAYDDPGFRAEGSDAWNRFDRIIVSLHTAKREPHRSRIRNRKWDMIIVDEAHHLRNRSTLAWRFASELEKQFILLLTATPVQNNLEELFNLVTLLEPGLLSTARSFQHRFVDRRDKLTPRNVDELHNLLAEVMVRNRRSTVGLRFTRRWARTERVTLSPAELGLYQDTAGLIRRLLQHEEGHDGLNRTVLLSLQMALGSSQQAAAGTLRRLAQRPRPEQAVSDEFAVLAQRAESLTESAKTQRLLTLLEEFADKMVIFTHFRATQEMLAEVLLQAGHDVALFHGGLSRLEKERAIRDFRGSARLLLATDAGSEGRNLQFAHAVCNFDLPWNPMRIEQRVGRLSRIGQTHDVHVFNLVAAGTVEAAVLHLLEAKLSMFELVIGEIDMILGNLDDEREFDDVVADLWAKSGDTDDFAERMEHLGNRLLAAKATYFAQRSHDDKLFGSRFAPEA